MHAPLEIAFGLRGFNNQAMFGERNGYLSAKFALAFVSLPYCQFDHAHAGNTNNESQEGCSNNLRP
jgi:hypothetical protein